MLLRGVDLETTGESPEDGHRIIEVGCVDVDTTTLVISNLQESLIFPEREIPPESSCIHHIVDADVLNAPREPDAVRKLLMLGERPPSGFFAHYMKFEDSFLTAYWAGFPLICTHKCALRQWPDLPVHSNQGLRYCLKETIVGPAMPPHRALPDINVTAHHLVELLKLQSLDTLIEWTEEPAVYPRLNFGKFRKRLWSDPGVDDGYYHWIINTSDMDDDVKFNAQAELDRRWDVEKNDGRAAEYVKLAKTLIRTATTVPQLVMWWKDEQPHRVQYGIQDHTSWYKLLVMACGKHKRTLLAQLPANGGGVECLTTP